MKHKFSEYQKIVQGTNTDKIVLRYYLGPLFHDLSKAFLATIFLEVVNFLDKRGKAQRGQLSLRTFELFLADSALKNNIDNIESRAKPIIQQRHAFVAHWGRVANISNQSFPVSLNELACIVNLISEVVDYARKKLLGLDLQMEDISPGGVDHAVAHLRHYEWLSHKQKQYALSGEPFLSPRWFDLANQTPQAEKERRQQEERILALVDSS